MSEETDPKDTIDTLLQDQFMSEYDQQMPHLGDKIPEQYTV